MGRFKFSALVGAALVVLPSAAALAADIPNIPPPPTHFGKTWYLRGDIGLAGQHMAGLDHPDFAVPDNFEWLDTGQFDGVPTFQLGIGFRHSEHLRFDATAQYRAKSSFSALDRYEDTDDADPDTFDGTNHYTGKKEEWLFLANAYYDFNPIHGIVPYVGAGVGASYNTVYDFVDNNVIVGAQGYAPTGHKWNLAWALHAGATMQVNDRMSVDLGYSFVSLGDAQTGDFVNSDPGIACLTTCTPMTLKGIYSHDVKLGVRWDLDGHTPSYYPPVVKY